MRSEEIKRALSIIVSQYYSYYDTWISKPYISSELIGSKCDELSDLIYCEQCCALKSSILESITTPILTINNIDIFREFVVANTNRCKQQRLPLMRNERLKETYTANIWVQKEVDVCNFLIITLFTDAYQKDPDALYHLISVFDCFIGNKPREAYGSMILEDTVELRKHLKGEVGNTKKTWLTIVDQGLMLFFEYNRIKKISSDFISELLNLEAYQHQDIDQYILRRSIVSSYNSK